MNYLTIGIRLILRIIVYAQCTYAIAYASYWYLSPWQKVTEENRANNGITYEVQ